MIKRVYKYISILLIIMLSFSVYSLYRYNKENMHRRELFVNHLYFEISNCIDFLSQVETGDMVDKQNSLENAVQELNRLDSLFFDASIFLDGNIHYSPGKRTFYQIGCLIKEGLSINNQRSRAGFLSDNKLSESETAFLAALKQDLEQVRNKLYSKETKQENPRLTTTQINEIFEPLFSKYYHIESLNLSNY